MARTTANLYKLNDAVFVIVGEDGLTNFGIVKGDDDSALLIDGDIPNWIQSIDHLLGQRFAYVVPEKLRDYLTDFHSRLLEAKAGTKSAEEIASYMKSGAYAKMGKTWMVKRNIEYFLKDGK